ncbi:MAG: DNA polymerase I [Bryobacteraceae bacterium]
MDQPRLFLIDAFGYIFRAYHARARSGAPPMRTRSGIPTEAVYIFHNMLRRLVSDHRPTHMAAVFEGEGPTLRVQAFEEYKANRPEAPPDLTEQIPWVRKLLEAMRIPVLSVPGYEADDLIGTLARRAADAGWEVAIISSDKDLLQLVSPSISLYNPMKNEWYDTAKVREFMGVDPAQVSDLLALKGDASDNIPGAPGIGDKGARDLILRFGSVEAALEQASAVERKTYRESLQNNRDRILLSKKLATIDTSVPIECRLDQFALQPPDLDALRRIYQELEFTSFLKELPGATPAEWQLLTLESPEQVSHWLNSIPPEAPVAVAVCPGGGELVEGALGLACKPHEGVSVSFRHGEALRPLLEDPARPKITHDLKNALLTLSRQGIQAQGFGEDVMLYSFLVEADPAACALDGLVARLLSRKPAASCEEQAVCIYLLAQLLRPELERLGLREVYEKIDLPLIPVLVRMEQRGIRIDPEALASLAARMEADIERLTAEIHALAGHPFNVNSPQQLAKVLFEELRLPVNSKTKKPSTAADVLEALAPEHPIAAKVLEYRQLAKLKGTYVDALPALIHPATGRLHTSLNPAGAATGRLSSSNPNLQNIPIRTELGREIRAAFLPREGWKLLVADYSQIELRLLAHYSKDPLLVEAFRNGEDIHTRTAAEVFGVPPLMVSPELRRSAKAVNFGIVYGLSAFGLAAQLGIPQSEAQKYIQGYFERYAGVKRFLEEQIAEVRRTGETRTLFGRRRPIPDINSSNPAARGFAERTAVNTPLQGSAADLIKLAMIAIDRELQSMGAQAAMLLQVHDELLFELPVEEVETVSRMVKREMENICRLEVPLVADIGVGDNWRDAK